MTEVILHTDRELPIGLLNKGEIKVPDGSYQKVMVKILREASEQEYIDFCRERKVDHLIVANLSNMYFYKAEILD